MTRSSSSFFTDPSEAQAALEDRCQAGLVVTGPGPFRARLTRIDLARLSLLSAEEWQPRVLFVRPPADQVIIQLAWDREPPPIWAGVSASPREVLTIRSVPGAHGRTVGHCHSAAIVCPTDHLVRVGRRLIGPQFVVPPGVARWWPAPDALKALIRLFRAAIRVTGSRLDAPTSPEAARGLEQQLVEALAECLSVAPPKPPGRREQFQTGVMARFEECLRTHPERLPSLAELSARLGLPARTLRAYCGRHLGVAPGRYLRLRRLERLRRELQDTRPGVTTVSALALRCGLAQPGRLAGNYRRLFGELPSETLRRGRAG